MGYYICQPRVCQCTLAKKLNDFSNKFVQVSCDQVGGEGGGKPKYHFRSQGGRGLKEGQIWSHDTWTAPKWSGLVSFTPKKAGTQSWSRLKLRFDQFIICSYPVFCKAGFFRFLCFHTSIVFLIRYDLVSYMI